MAEPQTPELRKDEEKEAEHRTQVRATVIHEAIRRDGEEVLKRSTAALLWSALASGLSMSMTIVAEASIRAHLPDAEWRPLIAKLGYPIGYLVVIIGKQQLFTENTLTPILPLMTKRDWRTLIGVLRLWAVVLFGNLIGMHVASWAIATTPILSPEAQRACAEIARAAIAIDAGTVLLRGIPAGMLLALVVWLRAAVDFGEVELIYVLMYVLGIANFTHVIVGSGDVLFGMWIGETRWWTYLTTFMAPALIGNTLGGISLVAALNHAQVVTERNERN